MTKNIITLNNISHKYPTGTISLKDVNLNIPEGKKIAILGGNGAGKSTIMLLLNGILKPSKGNICYGDKEYKHSKNQLRELRTKVGFIFHNPDNQLIAPTVFEEISFGLNNISKDKKWILEKAENIITDFCLGLIKDQSPHNLSAGQKKRVCMAAILAMEPEVVVCDEPASSLDPFHTKVTFDFLQKLNEQGKTILYSTHDVNQAYAWADHIIILKEGEVLSEGNPQEALSNKTKLEEAGLELPFIIEAALAINPSANSNELPLSMEGLKKLLTPTLCTDF